MPKKSFLASSFLIQNYIKKHAGAEAIKVISAFEKKKKPVKDEELAEHSKLKVTEIRAILNKLHYKGFVEYNKRKDKHSGWYHYTWTLNKKRVLQSLIEEQKEELKRLTERKQYNENYSFFSCKKACTELPFEIASEYNFKCPECGNETSYVDKEKQSKNLARNINTMKKQIEELEKLIKK